MLRVIVGILAVGFMVTATETPATAQLTVLEDSEAVVFDLTGEDGVLPRGFRTSLANDLIDLGSPIGLQGADVQVEEDGIISFEFLGGSIGRVRDATFSILGEVFANISGFENVISGGGGQPVGPEVEVEEGSFLDSSVFNFTATVGNGQLFSSASGGSNQVAVFVPSTETLTGLSSVIFAFEDAEAFTRGSNVTRGRTGFDDLIVSATFQAAEVPEPGTMLLLTLALGFVAWRVARP